MVLVVSSMPNKFASAVIYSGYYYSYPSLASQSYLHVFSNDFSIAIVMHANILTYIASYIIGINVMHLAPAHWCYKSCE